MLLPIWFFHSISHIPSQSIPRTTISWCWFFIDTQSKFPYSSTSEKRLLITHFKVEGKWCPGIGNFLIPPKKNVSRKGGCFMQKSIKIFLVRSWKDFYVLSGDCIIFLRRITLLLPSSQDRKFNGTFLEFHFYCDIDNLPFRNRAFVVFIFRNYLLGSLAFLNERR